MKTTKRIISVLVTALMVISLMSGFAPAQKPASNSTPKKSAVPAKKKVGVIIWGTEDGLGSSVKRLLDYAGKALNIDVVFKTGDYDTEAQVKAAENFVAAGVDGILCVPLIDSGIPKIYKVCADAKIPYVQAFRRIDDKNNAAQLDKEPYFLGYTVENEELAGSEMLKILAKAGGTKVGCIFNAPGSSFADRRKAGIKKALSDGVAKKLAEFTLPLSPTSEAWVEATNNFINTFHDMNGIIMTSGSVGGAEGAIATIIKNKAVGKVKMVTFDQPANAEEAFQKNILVGLASGIYTDSLYSFIILANKLQGNPLSTKPIKIAANYIYITNVQEAKDYAKYVDAVGVYPYTKEEIQQMTKFYNPSFSAEALQKVASQWTMANVLAKVKK